MKEITHFRAVDGSMTATRPVGVDRGGYTAIPAYEKHESGGSRPEGGESAPIAVQENGPIPIGALARTDIDTEHAVRRAPDSKVVAYG